MSVSDQFIVRSWRGEIDETNYEADDTEFEIGCARVRAGDAQSENDSIASKIGDGGDNEQSLPRPAALSAYHSDFTSTPPKSTDLVKPQSVVRVEGNGEMGNHSLLHLNVSSLVPNPLSCILCLQ